MGFFGRKFFVLFLVLVAACAPRGIVTVAPWAGANREALPIFVGTTRERDAAGRFDGKRQGQLSYSRFDIIVPPTHRPGKIEWPTGAPDPERHFLAVDEERFGADAAFIADLRRHLRAQPAGSREVVVYVHGFNNTFAEGLYRLAQLTHDFGLPTPAVHYSWPSAGNPLAYGYDRDSVLYARDGLERLLRNTNAAGADRVLLVGHSMGALLAMETLRQIAISDGPKAGGVVDGVILISPDIDVEVFRRQAARIGHLPQPFVIFTSQRDRALQLSARLTGQTGRLGNLSDVSELAALDVTLFDVTEFSQGGLGHFTAATSPALIGILGHLSLIEAAFKNDRSGRLGLLPGTVLAVQNATQVILTAQ